MTSGQVPAAWGYLVSRQQRNDEWKGLDGETMQLAN